MPARQLTVEQIRTWKIQGRSPGLRTALFNAEWESLCELAIQALETEEEFIAMKLELELLKAK